MIVLYKGSRGKGKTLTMVKDGYQYHKEGFKVISNFKTSFSKQLDNDAIMSLNKESNLSNCILLIDEIQIFFDSRQGMRKQNITFSNFIQQIRKRNITILCTTQFSNTVDLRLRQHLDIIAFPNFISKLKVCEVTYFDLTRLEDNLLIQDNGETLKPRTIKLVYNPDSIFKMYNTSEMII